MRPVEVLAVFAEAQVCEEWMGGNLNDALIFHGLRFHFPDCNTYGPLPTSQLCRVVIHQREDAYLFGRPVEEWTKGTIVGELLARGYEVQFPPCGDVEVPKQLVLSFEDDGRLVWVEVLRRTVGRTIFSPAGRV